MLDRQIQQHKDIFDKQVFNAFCEAVQHGTPKEFSDILYSRHTVEDMSFADDSCYWTVIDYFQRVVVPHKIAVYNAGKRLSELDWFDTLFINKEQFLDNLWLHDISKFSIDESVGYAYYNHATKSGKIGFEQAWHHHKQHNPHHPEYWMSADKSGVNTTLKMPKIYILEMVADWIGAGETYGNSLENWLPDNLQKFLLHPDTAVTLKTILEKMGFIIKWADWEDFRLTNEPKTTLSV